MKFFQILWLRLRLRTSKGRTHDLTDLLQTLAREEDILHACRKQALEEICVEERFQRELQEKIASLKSSR